MDLEVICLAITSSLREAERNLLGIRGRKGMFRAVQKVTDSDLRLHRLRLAGRAANVSFGYHGQAYCQYHTVR